MAKPIKALHIEEESPFVYRAWFDHKLVDRVRAVGGVQHVYGIEEQHSIYISRLYEPKEVLLEVGRVLRGSNKRSCNIKVEKIVGFAYDVWCDDEIAVKIRDIEGVVRVSNRIDGGAHFVNIDHRYDTGAVVAEILALDAIPFVT